MSLYLLGVESASVSRRGTIGSLCACFVGEIRSYEWKLNIEHLILVIIIHFRDYLWVSLDDYGYDHVVDTLLDPILNFGSLEIFGEARVFVDCHVSTY